MVTFLEMDIIGNFICGVVLELIFLILVVAYKKRHYIHDLLFGLCVAFQGGLYLCWALSDVFLSIPIATIGYCLQFPVPFFLIGSLDIINRDSIDPIKMIFCGLIVGAGSIIALTPNLFIIDPDGLRGVITNSLAGSAAIEYLIISGLILVYPCANVFYYFRKIYLHATPSLKKWARLALIGAYNFSIVIPCIVIFKIDKYVPIPAFFALMNIIAYLCICIAFIKSPRLAFILPSRLARITIFETTGGLPLYSYKWESEGQQIAADGDLFTSMIHGVSLLMKESVNRGKIRDIRLDDGILMLYHHEKYPIAVVLIATRYTRFLQECLKQFLDSFIEQNESKLQNVYEISQFIGSEKLVDQYFSFAK